MEEEEEDIRVEEEEEEEQYMSLEGGDVCICERGGDGGQDIIGE